MTMDKESLAGSVGRNKFVYILGYRARGRLVVYINIFVLEELVSNWHTELGKTGHD
jgi:hypothetical protein